jgi:hypothetical protein
LNDPLPAPNSMIAAATRLRASESRAVKVRVGVENSNYLVLDGKVLDDRRLEGTPDAPPGFPGCVWLNGELLYDRRPAWLHDRDGLDAVFSVQAKETGQLRAGDNTLVVQCASGQNPSREMGTLFVLLVDPATGARVMAERVDMAP